MIYEYGTYISQRREKRIVNKPSYGTRGKCTKFSKGSAARLRWFCVEKHVPGAEPYSATLTVRKRVTPEEWREALKRFRNYLDYHGIAGVWRVELQKRKVPHLHCIFWLKDEETQVVKVFQGWWKAMKIKDRASFRYSVEMGKLKDEGWIIYTALHNAKETQTGWVGKQWGVWGRSLFQDRQTEHLTISAAAHAAFLRRLRRYSKAQGASKLAYMKRERTIKRVINRKVIEQLLRGLETVKKDVDTSSTTCYTVPLEKTGA